MPIIKSADAPEFDLPGLKFIGLAAPSRGSTENAAWRISLAANTPGAPHQLTREEIIIAISGSAEAIIGTERFGVAAGDAVVVPAFTDFALGNNGDTPFEAVAVLPVGGRAMMAESAPFSPPWSL